MYEKYLNSRGILNDLLSSPNSLKLFKTIIQNPKVFWGSAHSPRFGGSQRPQTNSAADARYARSDPLRSLVYPHHSEYRSAGPGRNETPADS